MMKLLIFLGMLGFVCLAVPTFILVAWNWSEKLYGPLFAIALLAISITGSAVLVMLKPSRIETKLITTIIIDKKERLPVRDIPLPQENMKAHKRLREISSLGWSLVSKEGDKFIVKKPAENEITTFCLQLLQYKIVRDIYYLQSASWSVGGYLGTSGNWVSDSKVVTPVKLSKGTDIAGAEILRDISGNRFSMAESEKYTWKNLSFPFPARTKLVISDLPSPRQYLVHLTKPNFFSIDIRIKPLTGGGYPPTLPQGISISPEKLKNYSTFSFLIELDAKFEKLTAGNWQTQEHQAWINWIFSELRSRYTDSEDPVLTH